MARDIDALTLQMSADIRRFEKAMDRMAEVSDRRLTQVERRATQSQKNLPRIYAAAGADAAANFDKGLRSAEASITRSSAGIKAALLSSAGAIAAGFSADALVAYADSYTQLQNRLKVAGLEGSNLAAVQGKLYDAANKNGVAVNALADVYARANINAKGLGASQADLLKFTSTVSDAVRVQGTSTEAASGALLQLSQALGSGTVHAEEFNSLLEGLPILAQTAANNIDKYKGSVAALRADVVAGKVTSEELFQAILKGSGSLAAQAAKANLTIAASFTVLNNELGRYVGRAGQNLSVTEKLSAGIIGLAHNLDAIIPALGVIVALIGVRYVGAAAASTVATVRDTAAKAAATVQAEAYSAALASNIGLLNAEAAATARATASTAGLGGAMRVTGVVGARAGGAILAAFGGPIGVSILAVTAAVAGLTYAYQKMVEPTKQVKAATDGLSTSTDLYVKASEAAVGQSGDALVSALKEAAAKKELAKQSLAVSEGLLAEAKARLALARAQYTAGPGVTSVGPTGVQVGTTQSIKASLDIGRENNNIDALQASIEKAKAAIASGDAVLNAANGIRVGTGGGNDKGAKKAADQLSSDITSIYESGLTATEKAQDEYRQNVAVINEAFAKGLMNDLQRQLLIAREGAKLDQALNPLDDIKLPVVGQDALPQIDDEDNRKIETALHGQAKLYADVADAAEYSFARAKGSVGDFASYFAEQLQYMAAEWAASKLGELVFGERASNGDRSGGLLDFLSGRRASGGPVSAGGAYLVGEKRPEVFVPNTSGKIIPSVSQFARQSAMSRPSGATSINLHSTYHIEGAVGRQEIAAGIAQAHQDAVSRAVDQVRRNLPGWNGRLSSLGNI